MRLKIFVPLLALTLSVGAATIARAQDEEEMVRGSFLTTRVNSSGKSTSSLIAGSANAAASSGTSSSGRTTGSGRTGTGRTTGRKSTGRKSTTRVSGSGNAQSGNTTVAAQGNVTVTNATGAAPTYSGAIGLGYSLYMRDEQGNAVRVDPARDFRAGDRIRLALETNTDGYLYIFHTENDGEPQMLYPDARLEKGDNRIEAHVPYEIPWNEPGVENWFKFDANPANERLYVVVTREPLPGVPVGEQLVSYCGQNRCPWQPPAGAWAQLKASGQAKVGVVKSKTYGQKQTQAEQVAVTRGLGLEQTAPEPSVIRMNASSNLPILITAVDLIHR
ncbi:MAG TPA: DUF4384 domain-containing protein [Pyrinomonadaceae bacterium]|nr:DUF4384 domain-containing protein [Pyrinomonadaceae bacterium]